MIRQDEKQFFIAMLKEVNYQSFNVCLKRSAYEVAESIGLNIKRARFLLEKWFDADIWNCEIHNNKLSLQWGWFELDNLEECEFKEIYYKCVEESRNKSYVVRCPNPACLSDKFLMRIPDFGNHPGYYLCRNCHTTFEE